LLRQGTRPAGGTIVEKKKAAQLLIQAIKAKQKPVFQTEESWAASQAAEIKGVRLANGLDVLGAEDTALVNIEDLVHEAFMREAAIFEKMRSSGAKFKVDPVTRENQYGAVVAREHKLSRYEFWPSMAATLPLLALAARAILSSRLTAPRTSHSTRRRGTSRASCGRR